MPIFEVDIPPHVADVIRHLPPEIKRPLKAMLRDIAAVPTRGDPLRLELSGLLKVRVNRLRVIYSVDRRRRVVNVLAVGHRRRVYEDLVAELRRGREPR